MDGALSIKNIDYTKVHLHIKKSGGDVNQPTITTQHYPYMGKQTYYPFPNFRVTHHYKKISPAYKALHAVLETDSYNFSVNLSYFSYVFLNSQPYQDIY